MSMPNMLIFIIHLVHSSIFKIIIPIIICQIKLNDEKFASRIVQNPKIGFWEKLLDKMKR